MGHGEFSIHEKGSHFNSRIKWKVLMSDLMPTLDSSTQFASMHRRRQGVAHSTSQHSGMHRYRSALALCPNSPTTGRTWPAVITCCKLFLPHFIAYLLPQHLHHEDAVQLRSPTKLLLATVFFFFSHCYSTMDNNVLFILCRRLTQLRNKECKHLHISVVFASCSEKNIDFCSVCERRPDVQVLAIAECKYYIEAVHRSQDN